jgi:diaminopimelate epimerase
VQSFRGPEFVKGHGTENDFVVLPDPGGELKLTDSLVRALCDRRRGLGADGILRVVRADAVTGLSETVPPDVWFMDYRNADGSLAEMCGNGARVFARYLVESQLAEPGEFMIGTRAGVRHVRTHEDGRVTVDMGPATVLGESSTVLAGRRYRGVAVDVGNPHLACVTDVDIDTLDLAVPPTYENTMFPNGVNIEFVRIESPGVLRMRVHERGVGETRSCGTGTVAAAAAALSAEGKSVGRTVVQVPGGAVDVEIGPSDTRLTGPAVMTARGHLDPDWWQAAS